MTSSGGSNSTLVIPLVTTEPVAPTTSRDDDQLRLAMELSQKHQAEEEKRKKDEDEELEKILALSLMDK